MTGPVDELGSNSSPLSALPPLPGQPPSAKWSLPGSDYFKKDAGTKHQQHWQPANFPGVIELAWITYQRHVFGVDHVALFRHEHDPDDDAQDTSCTHVDEDNCPLYKTAIAVLFRLGVPPPKTASQPCPVFPDFAERDDVTLAVDQAAPDA